MPSIEMIKSKRIKWSGVPSPVTLAAEKAIRCNNKTKVIYPENPYCEVYTLRDNMYGIFSENADGAANQWAYLILGSEKALLIDTGFGIGDWKALCMRLIGERELLVTNTHASYDHSYGNAWFERVYAHKYSVPPLEALMTPHIWDYLFDEQGNNIWLDFDRGDLPTEHYTYEIIPVEDHHIFELGGGYEVELIWMPGHMAGHCFFLDRVNKCLFTGDGLENGRSNIAALTKSFDIYGRQFCNVESMHRQFRPLAEERLGEIESIFPGHGLLDIGAAVLPATLQALREILEAPEQPTRKVSTTKPDGKVDVRYNKLVPGFTELVYFPTTVHAPKE